VVFNPARLRVDSIETVVAGSVMFCFLLFAFWTLAHHAATFGGISWHTLTLWAGIAGLPMAIFAAWASRRFASAYAAEVQLAATPAGLQGTLPAVVFLVAIVLLFAIQEYTLRFGIAVILLVTMWGLTRAGHHPTPVSKSAKTLDVTLFDRNASWILVLCAVFAVAVTLAAHRPDLDDASFLQIAVQTLLSPERAPLTFDASLGIVMKPFRFAPYRLASYETLAALLVEWIQLDLLTIYYLLLPGLTAILTIGVAFMFTRWFLPRGLAVMAVIVFILIMLAWSGNHRAYGNFGFVRLFQGKALLIMLTTPITVIAGLLLLRHCSAWNWTFLATVHLAAIGVSSSGLFCSFVTTGLIMIVAFRNDIRASLVKAGIVGTTLFYAAILGVQLKFAVGWFAGVPGFTGGASPAGSEIHSLSGSFWPINISLGFGPREALSLALIIFGVGALTGNVQRQWREYTLFTGAALILIFNPWLSELLSMVTTRNVSWRLAWAVPVPLLMAVALTASIPPLLKPWSLQRLSYYAGAFVALGILIAFLVAGQWTIAGSNHVTWRWPSFKVPAEFVMAQKIAVILESQASKGMVLSNKAVAAWLPLTAPDVRQVMPGHYYPAMLRAILPPQDFSNRRFLLKAVSEESGDMDRLMELIQHYGVTTLVLSKDSNAGDGIVDALRARAEIHLEEIAVVGTYRILALRPTS